MTDNYQKLMDKLLALPTCVLFATGRAGADFLHSLLDSHPEVLTFNGYLFYHEFWDNSMCVKAGNFDVSDFLDEFIGKHIEKFKSRYDLLERKNELGDDYQGSINIEIDVFKSHVKKLLEGRKIDSKNSLLAIYAAYAMCLGQDITQKTLLFHHLHHVHRLDLFFRDFPESKIVIMTRDPRASFVSGIENRRRYLELYAGGPVACCDRGAHLYFYLARLLHDASVMDRYDNPYLVVKVEDLDQEIILKKLAQWLNISFHPSMKKSTWGGLSWHGDRLSVRKIAGDGLSRDVLKNQWEKKLSWIDQYLFNYLMHNMLKHYGYKNRPVTVIDVFVVPILIPLPLKYELRYFSFNYLYNSFREKDVKRILSNVINYFKRVILYYNFYFKTLRNKKFSHPFLAVTDGSREISKEVCFN